MPENETMKVNAEICHGKQREVMEAFVKVYDGNADEILNALHEMAARVAFSVGVEPQTFVAGVQYHWNALAKMLEPSDGRRH